MLEPEQILHASMILSVESEKEQDPEIIIQIQDILGCDSSDYDAAMSHIEQHRDDGNWGGRSEAVLNRSRERVREAMNTDVLPSDGPLAEALISLIGEDEDDGEIDPFAELGVATNAGSFSSNTSIDSNDPLAAFMEDDEEGEELVDDSGFFSGESSIEIDNEEESSENSETNVDEVEEMDDEIEPEISADEGYEMLMATCWIDGILDPAEAKLLARKREELGITFEQHLDMLRKMLENSS
tara:strand:- start:775 stop:1497 length:723 start_codon:yes stop_codon:yes gene_type:complete